jgi:DNA-binding XRE family transcriptional regulator
MVVGLVAFGMVIAPPVEGQAGDSAVTLSPAVFFLVRKYEHGYDNLQCKYAQELRNGALMLAVQSRMARAAIGWGVRDLAAAARVSPDTIARFERGESLYPRTLEAIRSALEAAGIEFIEENGGGPGVRLRRTAS